MFSTADLYDKFGENLQVATPLLDDYGGRKIFSGQISTVKVFEDNSLVRTALEENGDGKILVVDGGSSLRCALLGDMLADLGKTNNWNGVIVNGCIRDCTVIARIDFGVKAMNTNPRKSVKKGVGERDIPVSFADVTFNPGDYVYADPDGIVISTQKLV